MRIYETVFILPSNLPEEEQKKVVEGVKSFITKNEGRILDEKIWKNRRFAYPIKKFTEGSYFILKFETENSNLSVELERFYRMNQQIIRFSTFKEG
ncbi:MAG: 30S ribosomal protein S6 [Caldiserica bacterium]|nr:MAG: 30S ribosomal protein S6 [Caldisericota bacterium]